MSETESHYDQCKYDLLYYSGAFEYSWTVTMSQKSLSKNTEPLSALGPRRMKYPNATKHIFEAIITRQVGSSLTRTAAKIEQITHIGF